jgi:hypothetical protein
MQMPIHYQIYEDLTQEAAVEQQQLLLHDGMYYFKDPNL